MADVVITPGSVVQSTGGTPLVGTAGATITAGQLIYLDSATTTIKLAKANTSLATASCIGVALNGGSTGQPINYISGFDYVAGGALTVGGIYLVSGTNAGGLAPVADLAAGWYTCVFGVARTTTILTIINRGASTLVAVP